ncbi:MAG TPA: ABC transporter permease [Thermodesulfobacteriota bacterium]|nr:ABC transporter permease [Thermodesulfobacteriota bacterium]
MDSPTIPTAGMKFLHPDSGTLAVSLSGEWTMGKELPSAEEVRNQLESARARRIVFDTGALGSWDSMLLTFLLQIQGYAAGKQVEFGTEGLPDGARGLLNLALAVPERKGARKEERRDPFLTRVGDQAINFWRSASDMVAFIGEACLALGNLARGKARFRTSDLMLFIQQCGADALPIVSLISILVGLILAFVAAIQLKMFGATIFVADIVGIAMIRTLGAVMTGVILAGRTGAAFAAQLGTMQVNEEIDALQTLGVPAMEFLVLPRMLALAIMMPFLCLYADLMGVLGGLFVGVFMLDLNPMQYIHQTQVAVRLYFVWIGLFTGLVFGVLIALAGCLRGMQCGRSASEVGQAATSAVVTSIVSIVIATALITFVCQVIGI